MSSEGRSRRYRHLDAALVRATTHPGSSVPSFCPDLDDEADVEQWCAWLTEIWAQAPIVNAVTIASPVLAARVAAVCQGQRPRASQVRRMVLSLARYLVRMRGRATPFALFAGVAPLHFGPQVSALWTDQHHVRVRADTVWLTGVIARLESCAALRHRLPTMMNDLAFVRGERLVVPWQPHAGDPARSTAAEVSVRRNRAVQTIMQAASSPIQGSDLIEKLAAEIPDAPVSALEGVLAELIACGALITSLRPPSTSTDGLAHVLDQLQDVNATALGEVAPLVQELVEIRAELDTATRSAGSVDGQVTASRMRVLSSAVEQPLMLDLRLGCAMVLPPQVATEAANAAGALLRLTPHPGGHPAWRDFHTRFLARYGVGALVLVEQLVDPTAGLGFPAHYAEPGQPTIPAEMSRRNERLLALAQQAALDGVQEVVLEEDFLDALAPDGAGELRPATHVGLCAEVCAPTMAALTEGAFTLMVIGVSRTGVALTGRFLDLLPDEDRQRMIGLYGELPVGVDGAIPAQLSFPPKHPRMENVACAPRLLPDLISVAEHRDGERGRLPIQDLAVTADNDRLYLVSLSRRRVVEPMLTNAAARHTMPPIARFLFEIPRARHSAVSPFAWGMAGCLPFLPRVRYGRTVLVLARWRIPGGALPGPDAPWPVWVSAMDALRERLRLPASVSVGEADRLLRLSLDEPMDLALLRDHLDKANKAGDVATVSEAPSAADHGWFAGRAHEIVVPLAATAPPAPAPAVVNISGPLPLIGREDGVLPGSHVLFAKVYGHPDVFDTILTRYLPELLSTWEEPPRWWFVRYRDPRPHLRLRLHLARAHDYGKAVVRVGAWTADLRRRGLVGDLALDTYYPETARYGSGAAQTAAEALFAADSAAVLAQLETLATAREVHSHALTAASMVDLASALTGSLPAGMRWLIDHANIGPTPAPDRDIVRQTIRLADLSGDRTAFHAIAGGPQITAAWRARRDAAATYVERLATDAAHVKPASAFGSLLHMHHIRAHGINPDSERLCHRLARAVALAWAARHDTTEEGHR
ncbi:MAG: Lantibiotic dehydratase domain protein [Actinoallomurus sp.]|nr:Lantibiotic dehydratase domain protein [Actinoallomurus sp.]